MCTDRKENNYYSSDTLAKFEDAIDAEVQHLEIEYPESQDTPTYNGDDE